MQMQLDRLKSGFDSILVRLKVDNFLNDLTVAGFRFHTGSIKRNEKQLDQEDFMEKGFDSILVRLKAEKSF